MKTVTVHVTQEIINESVATDECNCLLYNAILPLLKDEYKAGLEVGVVNAAIYDKHRNSLVTIKFSKEVENYIIKAIRNQCRGEDDLPQSFEIEIPEEFLKD